MKYGHILVERAELQMPEDSRCTSRTKGGRPTQRTGDVYHDSQYLLKLLNRLQDLDEYGLVPNLITVALPPEKRTLNALLNAAARKSKRRMRW